MARNPNPVSALDKLYAKLDAARKRSRGKTVWKKSMELCDPRPMKHPCKTTYKSKGGSLATVRTSRTASFGMPKRLRSLSDLRGTKGVALPRKLSKRFKFKGKGSRGLGRYVGSKRRKSPGRPKRQPTHQDLLFAAARKISLGQK